MTTAKVRKAQNIHNQVVRFAAEVVTESFSSRTELEEFLHYVEGATQILEGLVERFTPPEKESK